MSADDHPRSPLRRIGALWSPKPGATSKGSGTITIRGWKQRFVILPNLKKIAGTAQPDYVLMSGDAPEEDTFTPAGASGLDDQVRR